MWNMTEEISEFLFLREIIKKYGDKCRNNYTTINNNFYNYEKIIERYNELMEELLEEYEMEDYEIEEDE